MRCASRRNSRCTLPMNGARFTVAAEQPTTRDHFVPRMYLKRFGRHRSGGAQLTAMTSDLGKRFLTSVNDVAVERGFYWGSDVDGIPHHELENFLALLETQAAPAFRRILDSGSKLTDDALPTWPPRSSTRLVLSWWIGAQILRTKRQRLRLDSLARDASNEDRVAYPDSFDSANRHLRYIAERLERLVSTIYSRPWGIGFADHCLLTGDCPVLVINGQDHPDQVAAVKYWDVYVPLDPHRCLYLPGFGSTTSFALRRDHRFKLHPGEVLGLNSLVIDTAVRHVFYHPDHDPTEFAEPAVISAELPQFLLNYEVLPDQYGVERRWLETHPPQRTDGVPRTGEDEAMQALNHLTAELERRNDRFNSTLGRPNQTFP